ncbi:DUF692 domain-containing protein [Ramlibacter sp.]|uniref:MNIO family bufferin maturase n=1 Tax=Ramlibacter sp. TaxID=1917967 RepID=UPI003D0DF1EC
MTRPRSALPAGCGVGLKPQHYRDALEARAAPSFVEVHAENYMVDGGPFHHWLGRVRECRALSLHGVGLSIGGEEPLDEAHLARLAALIERYEPAAFSEHLAWSSHGDVFLNDLLPLAYDAGALARVCDHVDRVQARLGCRMLLENPATYLELEASTLAEAQFLGEVVARTGCGLLLDVNNVHVGCVNRDGDAHEYLEALPLHAVGEIHLAGFARELDAAGAPLLIDDHGSAVDDAVWMLYRSVVERLGPCPTLIEWDNDVPEFEALLAEAGRAQAILAACSRKVRP